MEYRELDFFNVWETHSQEDQVELVEAMRGEARWIADHEGFISLTVWSCADDKRIIVQGRWKSADDFRAAIADNPEAAARREAMTKFGHANAGVYILEFVRTHEGDV